MGCRRQLAIVGNLADFPEALDVSLGLGLAAHILVARQNVEHDHVFGKRRAAQAIFLRKFLERVLEGVDGGEIEMAVTPLQHGERIEPVLLQHGHSVFVERRAASRGPERAIPNVPAGASRDLRHLRGRQATILPAVIFAVAGKGDVINIEIEAHADRIGGHDIVDLAGLVEFDLRIAGARRERAQNHGRAATRAAQDLGDGINLFRREGDNRAAARQPRQFALARKGQLREPRAGDDLHAGQQTLDQRTRGFRTQQKRFIAPAAIEQPVGEDVPAVEVSAQLHLVNGDEGDVEIARHRFDRGNPVARMLRLDLLFAGDQRDGLRPDLLDHAIIDLAGQQAQRQADDARRMIEHPLDGQMRLAGVGGPKHCRDAGGSLRRLQRGMFRGPLKEGYVHLGIGLAPAAGTNPPEHLFH